MSPLTSLGFKFNRERLPRRLQRQRAAAPGHCRGRGVALGGPAERGAGRAGSRWAGGACASGQTRPFVLRPRGGGLAAGLPAPRRLRAHPARRTWGPGPTQPWPRGVGGQPGAPVRAGCCSPQPPSARPPPPELRKAGLGRGGAALICKLPGLPRLTQDTFLRRAWEWTQRRCNSQAAVQAQER